MQKYDHPLSWNAISRVVVTGLVLLLVWKLQSTIMMIIVSMMLTAALFPITKKLSKHMPITLAATLVVLLMLVPLLLVFGFTLPSFLRQTPDILNTLTEAIRSSTIVPDSLRSVDLTQYSSRIGTYLLQSTSTITNAITTFLTLIFLTLYFLIDFKRLQKIIISITPKEQRERLENLTEELSRINGQYIRGNLIISVICFVFIFTGLIVLKVPFSFSLALFAAITDLLPLVGAFIGAIPAIIIAFTISPTVGVFVVALFLIYQQIENNVFTPLVYNKALDLSPALSFIAVIIGGALFGIVGAFIALPIAASIPTLIKYFREQ